MQNLMQRLQALAALVLVGCVMVTGALASPPSAVLPYSDYHQRLWDTKDGMPQISALSMVQDQHGLLWVATEGGLVSFDGDHFEIYDGRASPLFLNPLLRTLFHSSDNTLWVGSSGRLIKKTADGFQEVLYQETSLGSVESIAEFDGALYIGGAALHRISLPDHQVTAIEHDAGPVTAMLALPERLWIAHTDSLGYIREGQYHAFPIKGLQPQQQLRHLTQHDDRLLIGTSLGLYQFASTGDLSPYLIDGEPVTEPVQMLYQDRQGVLWMSLPQRLWQVKEGHLIEQVTQVAGQSNPWFVSAFEDRNGFLWLGSMTHGLQRLRYDGSRNHSLDAGLREPYVWAILESGEGLLVGGNSGLYRWDGKRFQPQDLAGVLPNPVVYTLMEDSSGNLWLGTRSGLVTLDHSGELLRGYPALDHLQINGMAEGVGDEVWIATLDGLFLWDGQRLEEKTAELGLQSAGVRMVYVDRQQRLWVATVEGMYRLSDAGVEDFSEDPLLSSTYIAFIGQLQDDRMVVGTMQSGIAVEGEESWHWLNPSQLPATSAFFVGQRQQQLYVSNFNGLYQVDLASFEPDSPLVTRVLIDDFGAESDVDGVRCCNGAGNGKGLLRGNRLYLPSLNGLVSLDLDAQTALARSPEPLIEGLDGGNDWFSQSPVRLAIGQRDVRFQYTAPWFYRNSALRFRYRLQGYDQGWTEVIERREAFYTNLPAGAYRFELQTRLADVAQWSDADSFAVDIAAYWYERWWFQLLIGLMLIGLIFLGYRLRLHALERARQTLSRKVAEQTSELHRANAQLATANEQLQQASLTDALTGLHNRRYLNVVLPNLLARSDRGQRGFYVVLLDLDNFKQLNDQLGHAVGDEVLMAVAKLLSQQIRSSDHLVRWGGEEFLILLESSKDVHKFMQRLLQAFDCHSWPAENAGFAVSCSVGVCFHPAFAGGWSWDNSLVLADKAMYLVKEHGKAGWLLLKATADAPQNLAEHVTRLNPEELLHSGWFDCEGSTVATMAR